MIRWCAYCQKHQGEAPPFDDFEITHGICDPCRATGVAADAAAIDRLRPVTAFYRRVAESARDGASAAELMEAGLRLGLAPWDLLVGILQPALRRMGRLWAEGAATVADEHRLTATCAAILALLHGSQPGFAALRQAPVVLLVNAEGNFHTLGIQLVEFFLLSRAVPVLAVHPGLPTAEVLQLVQVIRPAKLGISCALQAHLDSARATSAALAALPERERPALYVGGFARHLAEGWAGPFTLCACAADLLDPPRIQPSE